MQRPRQGPLGVEFHSPEQSYISESFAAAFGKLKKTKIVIESLPHEKCKKKGENQQKWKP